ncbi:MAG: cytochrome c maturation protein CcmE [Pontixanthobacter sp.]
MTAAKAKHQRLVLIVIAIAALIAAALLAAWALRSEANYFYLPGQLDADPPPVGQAIRLGGMVQEGSIRTMADGVTVAFIVTDKDSATVPVRYSGILPDLFVEGSGVVADGRLDAGGTFVADNLLAKHDENYVPRELQELDRHKADETLMRTTEPSNGPLI